MSLAIHRWFRRISLFIFELLKNKVIFAHQNLISNWLTYLVHAKSTGELISFGFSDRSVGSLVSANRWVQTKKRFHFLAYLLWSQSEFRTQRNAERKTDPKNEMTNCWYTQWNHLYTVFPKNAPTLASCSFNKHGLILIIFGKHHQHTFKTDMIFNLPYQLSLIITIKRE